MKMLSTQRYNFTQSKRLYDSGIHEGMIIIPDISGYTRFVHSTDVITGISITHELLSTIIENDILDLQVSEIEGDAILFYKLGKTPPSAHKILEQYEIMLEGFHEKLAQINRKFGRSLDLSLKLVAHYGSITEYSIGGFRKLYGKAVIEAHRLLKNSVNSRSYALLTDELIEASCPAQKKESLIGFSASKLCEVYGGLRNICFTYFDYEQENAEKMTNNMCGAYKIV